MPASASSIRTESAAAQYRHKLSSHANVSTFQTSLKGVVMAVWLCGEGTKFSVVIFADIAYNHAEEDGHRPAARETSRL
jgi:hypothetical protein